jgi:ribosome biogenesis GTPase / thiamine phosphate phosphatase
MVLSDRPPEHDFRPEYADRRPPVDGMDWGVVVRVDRGAALVESAGELVRASWGGALVAAAAEDSERWPCTGDRVWYRRWPDGRVTVEVIGPRRTLLTRSDASRRSQRQALAANLDLVAVVEGLLPDPDPIRVERLLAVAWTSGAQPLVVLTKADLVPEPRRLAVDVLGDVVAGSQECELLVVSSTTGAGIDRLAELLAGGRTMALLGASGVGKSSLLNALAGVDRMRVRALRADGRGRHTTVTRELHQVAGGAVIDGPGLRSVAVSDEVGLDRAFVDVQAFAARCRFTDCSHSHEPGCAVLAAVDDGELSAIRLDSWRALTEEGLREQRRRDARLRAEQNRQWRIAARAARRRSQD